jgi:nucleotide-binding universal stress UspA family protein
MISIEELPRFAASVDELIEEKSEANHVYEALTRRAVAQAQAQGVNLTPHVVIGHPVTAISDFVASGGFDLLVVGFMGHSALYNRLIGSTTDRLVEHAPSAVLVIK